MTDVEKKVDHIEWRLDSMEEQCKSLHKEHHSMRDEIRNIGRIIFQVKWLIIGALIFAIASDVGITTALKTALVLG